MNVARDMMWITLPFAVGVLLTVYAGASFHTGHAQFTLLLLSATALAETAIITRRKLKLEASSIQAVIIICAGLCGALSGMTGVMLETSWPASGIRASALSFCGIMQNAIDSIPFESEQTGALIKALLTGERSSLPREVTEAFRESGASHILALSGLHMGVIYGVLSGIMSILGNSPQARRLRSVLMISACGFYTMAVGAGPSIVRAFIFIALRETARATGRHYELGHILLASMLIQLTVLPLSVRSTGFQLSYAAMAGIAFIYPWLKGLWPTDDASSPAGRILGKCMKWMWNSLALSTACQITTGPLAYIHFGTFPVYFLLTNLLALPLTGILIPSALATLCLSSVGWCPPPLVTVTEALARLMLWSLHTIASM